jgi:hypothetical protein
MTKTTYHGATFLLAEDPGAERVAEIVNTIVEEHFHETQCSFELSKILPNGLPVDVADQLLAHQKGLGPSALFLLVEPVGSNYTSKVPNGKIPS